MMGKDGLDNAREIRHAYRMASQPFDPWQEVSLVTFTLRLTPLLRQQLYRRLHQAYASGSLRLVKRLHALLAVAEGMAVRDVAQMLDLGEQTVRDYLNRFFWQGLSSCVYTRPPGRPAKLTKTQRKALAELIQAGPQAAGLYLGLLEHADHSRPDPPSLWRRVPSALPLYLAAQPGIFLSKSPLCVRSPQRDQASGVAANQVAAHCTASPPAQGAAALW